MLEVGIKAPDFELPDQNGEMHKLSDYAGKKVILYFNINIHIGRRSKCLPYGNKQIIPVTWSGL